jgi:hypothetical protein
LPEDGRLEVQYIFGTLLGWSLLAWLIRIW